MSEVQEIQTMCIASSAKHYVTVEVHGNEYQLASHLNLAIC